MSVILLDRRCDADVPDGYNVIDTERAFLAVAGLDARVMVRGSSLCDWAAQFYTGRGVKIEETESPLSLLQAICPELELAQVNTLLNRIRPQLQGMARPWRLPALLQLIYPNSLWDDAPSRLHAAEWLLWLHQNQPSSEDAPLRRALARQWQQMATGPESALYTIQEQETATSALLAWLDVEEENPYAQLRPFPGDIPKTLLDAATNRWKKELIQTSGAAITSLLARPLLKPLRLALAKVAYEHFTKQPKHLTAALFSRISSVLTTVQQDKLRGLLPPPPLPDLPEEPGEMLSWFSNHYVPYRLWQVSYGDEGATARVHATIRTFASWYLEHYRAALAGGVLAPYLAFNRMATLRQSGDKGITLVVVLDGLQWADAQQFLRALDSSTSRLTFVNHDLAFAPLPTVTEFCKESLFHGTPPVHVPNTVLLGVIEPDLASPLNRLDSAQPGDLVFWRVMEPDATYHDRNSAAKLSYEIEAVLDGVAAKLAEVVETLDPRHSLRVVITTDHGRLLGRATRSLQVPAQMQSHGRAAWGNAERSFPSAGYVLEQELAYLHREAFGLPTDAAVIVSEKAFLTADGKSGSEMLPHGGLSPEEVMIPWCVALRDFRMPELEVQVTGSGRAGAVGHIDVFVTNYGGIAVTCIGIVLSAANGRTMSVDFRLDCAPNEQAMTTVEINNWPTAKMAETMKAIVHVVLPNGQDYSALAGLISLSSEEMYAQTDILEGLDL